MSASAFPLLDDSLTHFAMTGVFLIPRAALPAPPASLFVAGRQVTALAACPWDDEQVLLTTEHPDTLQQFVDAVVELS